MASEQIDHPDYCGGAGNPYETIKVMEAWNLGTHLDMVLKYIPRAGKKDGESLVKDLKKAVWWLQRKIATLEASR